MNVFITSFPHWNAFVYKDVFYLTNCAAAAMLWTDFFPPKDEETWLCILMYAYVAFCAALLYWSSTFAGILVFPARSRLVIRIRCNTINVFQWLSSSRATCFLENDISTPRGWNLPELLVILTSFYTILFICFLNYHFYGSVCSYPKAFKLDSVIDCAVKAK